jgi:Trk-type K+ transport system membrane component
MGIQEFREKVNLRLYKSKGLVNKIMKTAVFIASITAIATLIYYYGFPQTEETKFLLLNIFQGTFVVYLSNYFIQFIFDFEPIKFIKRTWIEGLVMLFLIVEGISYNFFDHLLLTSFFNNLGFEKVGEYSNLLIQLYFLIVVWYEIAKGSNILPKLKLNPAALFLVIFIVIMSAGAGLLMLPEMTTIEGSMSFIDALFTSTSAATVTGLSVQDTANFFTFKGQFIILLLIKLGGLNVIAFGSFIALFSKFGVGVKQHSVIEDFFNKSNLMSARGMLAKVIIWSLFIEIVGAAIIFFAWSDEIAFVSIGDRLFSSIFHSVSALNSAGFSLFSDGLYEDGVRSNYLVQNILCVLLFLGAIGFMAIFDLFSIKRIRERIKTPWKKMQFATKISFYTSLWLIFFGALFFYLFEGNHSLAGEDNILIKISHSVFQSVTTRSGGLNTVDISALSLPTVVIFIFLMIIGGASSSTGGGIKTSTFAIIWAATISTIKNKKRTELFSYNIPVSLVLRAYSVFLFFIIGLVVGCFGLAYTESALINSGQFTFIDLIFEEVSAFGTVGLSRGPTSYLSEPGKLILITSMFAGRVGLLTVAYALTKESISTEYKYADGHTMVG